jgi:PIN domain nuclease of toxin-antitoxin system
MRVLLDTYTLLWWVAGQPLTDEATGVLSDTNNLAFVSAVSIWEISIKQALGKLTVEGDLDAVVVDDFEQLDIGFNHARLAGELPPHHRDPFDRLLIAQAQIEGLTILTRDPKFAEYDVDILVV